MNVKTALLISVCFTSFCSSFMSSTINIAVPAISATFTVPPEYVTWAVSAYVITITAFLLPATALANRFGYRRIYALGALTAGICALVVPLLPAFGLFIAGRAVQGLFNALIFCTATALLSDNITGPKRGGAIGIMLAAVYAGLTFSPSLGGILTDTLGWRSLFYITAAGCFTACVLIRKVPFDKANTNDLPLFRMTLCFVAAIIILCNLSQLLEHPAAKYLLAAGTIPALWYLVLEHRAARPLLPLKLLCSNRILSFSLCASLLNYMATFVIALLLSLHLQLLTGMSASKAGLFLMLQPLLQCLLSPLAGRLSSKVSPHLIAIAGMLLSTAATAIFMLLESTTPLWIVLLGQALAGIGFGLFSAPNTSIIMGSVDRSKFALASGLQALSRNGGMSLSITMIMVILFLHIDATPDSTLYLYELNYAIAESFMFCTLLGAAGIVFCVLGRLASVHQLPHSQN